MLDPQVKGDAFAACHVDGELLCRRIERESPKRCALQYNPPGLTVHHADMVPLSLPSMLL